MAANSFMECFYLCAFGLMAINGGVWGGALGHALFSAFPYCYDKLIKFSLRRHRIGTLCSALLHWSLELLLRLPTLLSLCTEGSTTSSHFKVFFTRVPTLLCVIHTSKKKPK